MEQEKERKTTSFCYLYREYKETEVVVMAVLAEEVGGRGDSAACGNESKTVCSSFLSVLNGLDSVILSTVDELFTLHWRNRHYSTLIKKR